MHYATQTHQTGYPANPEVTRCFMEAHARTRVCVRLCDPSFDANTFLKSPFRLRRKKIFRLSLVLSPNTKEYMELTLLVYMRGLCWT